VSRCDIRLPAHDVCVDPVSGWSFSAKAPVQAAVARSCKQTGRFRRSQVDRAVAAASNGGRPGSNDGSSRCGRSAPDVDVDSAPLNHDAACSLRSQSRRDSLMGVVPSSFSTLGGPRARRNTGRSSPCRRRVRNHGLGPTAPDRGIAVGAIRRAKMLVPVSYPRLSFDPLFGRPTLLPPGGQLSRAPPPLLTLQASAGLDRRF
jgi:hypothetical protein